MWYASSFGPIMLSTRSDKCLEQIHAHVRFSITMNKPPAR